MSTTEVTREVSNVVDNSKDFVNLEQPAKTVFPPPINWNGHHAAASRPEMFAYLSGSVIVVARVKDDSKKSNENMSEPTWPTFTMMGSQKDNYTCISLSQQELLPLEDSPLVTGDSIGFVKIWNVEDRAYPLYHTAHKPNVVMDVVWSPRDANLIYSIDSAGLVTIWNIRESTLKTINYDRPSMSCLAVSPYEDHIIAVGFLSGSILIVDTSTQSGEILCKMNHSCDLISVSWVPQEFWSAINLESHHKTPLLISAVHTMDEPTIRVWDRQGNDVSILSLGEKKDDTPVAQPARGFQKKQFKTLISTAWIVDPITQELKLFSSFKNNVVFWKNLSEPFTVVHDIHRFGSIFTMVQTGEILWSFGSECMIVGYNLRLGEKDVIVPTYKGICNIHMSPVLRSQLAFGGGDGIIRIINMHSSYPTVGPYEPPVLTGRIHDAKITAVCWHPFRDNVIGLGTNEGILGVYEYRDNNRHTKLCERRVNGTIYGLDWGPQCYTKAHEEKRQEKYGQANSDSGNIDNKEPVKSNLVLYACGGDRIHMINPMYTSATLVNVGTIIRQSNVSDENRGSYRVTEIRWCPDRIFFCVGYADGRIDIYAPPYLKLRCSIKCHTRDIQHLCWRPYDFGQYTDSLSKWLASSSNDGTIRLYNLADLYSKQAKGVDETKFDLIRQSASTLNGHNGIRVIALAWSPHDPKLLVSVSYDRSAVIWNIIDGSRIARYCGHSQRLVGAMFHPSNKYQVLTCSDELINDFSMHVWDYRDYPYKEVPDGIITQVASRKQAIKVERIEKEQEPVRLGTFTSVHKGTIYKGQLAPELPTEQQENPTITYIGCGAPQLVKEKSLLPLASNFLDQEPDEDKIQQEIESLIDYNVRQKDKAPSKVVRSKIRLDVEENSKCQDGEDGVSTPVLDETVKDFVMHLGLNDVVGGEGLDPAWERALKSEISRHISDGAWDNASHISVWMGNHADIVELALKKNEVSQSIVELVLANPYSTKFRAQVISAYSKKLEANNDIPLAAHYLLTIGHDEDAVDLYLRKHYFHEAFTLAKTRLRGPVRCEAMKKVHSEWAADLVDQGKYLRAIRMYCTTMQLSKALEVLELWNTSAAWKLGISVATTAKDGTAGDSFGMKYIEDALAHGLYDECLTIIRNYDFLNWLLPIVLMHQRLCLCLNTVQGYDDGTDLQFRQFVKTLLIDWASLKVCESSKDKILALLKMVIPQNKEEALYVIARYMSLMLLDNENLNTWKENLQPIANTWFGTESRQLQCIKGCIESLSKTSVLEEEVKIPAEEVEDKIPTEVEEVKIPAEEVEVKIPTEMEEVKIPTEEEEVKIPTEVEEVKIPAEEVEVKIPAEEVEVKIPTEEEEVKIPTEVEEVKIPAEEVEVKIPTEMEKVKIPTEEEEVKIPTEVEEVKIPAEEVEVKIPTEEEEVKIPVSDDEIIGLSPEPNQLQH